MPKRRPGSLKFRFAFDVRLPRGLDRNAKRVVKRLLAAHAKVAKEPSAPIDVSNLADITRSVEDLLQTMARARASAHNREKE